MYLYLNKNHSLLKLEKQLKLIIRPHRLIKLDLKKLSKVKLLYEIMNAMSIE